MVLIITAYATVETAVAAFRRGAHDYLMKPVIFDELLLKLDRLIRFRRLTRENQAMRRQLHAPVDLETLIGASEVSQIEGNIGATDLLLDDDQLGRLTEAGAPPPSFGAALTSPFIRRMVFGGHDVKSWGE